MFLQVQLLICPDIIERAAGQDNLPSCWVGHALLRPAHEAVVQQAVLVPPGKVTDSLRADMVVIDLAVYLTA